MSKRISLSGWVALLSLAAAQGCSSDSTPAAGSVAGSSAALGGAGAFSPSGGQGGMSNGIGGASSGGASAGSSAALGGDSGSSGSAGSGGSGGAASGATADAGGSSGGAAGAGGATAGAGGSSGGAAGAGGGGVTAGAGGSGGASGSGGPGGSGGSGGSTSPPAKWSQVYTQILVPLCGSTCHNGNTSTKYGGGLDIFPTDSMRAYGNVVNQLPKPSPAGLSTALSYKCTGKGMRVVKGDAAKSILYSKVHDATPICGAPEPQAPVAGGPGSVHAPLTQAQLDMIASWINAGALND